MVCSATIDAEVLLDFFLDSNDEPTEAATARKRQRDSGPEQTAKSVYNKGTIISVDGRQYPVDIMYLYITVALFEMIKQT